MSTETVHARDLFICYGEEKHENDIRKAGGRRNNKLSIDKSKRLNPFKCRQLTPEPGQYISISVWSKKPAPKKQLKLARPTDPRPTVGVGQYDIQEANRTEPICTSMTKGERVICFESMVSNKIGVPGPGAYQLTK